MTWVDLGTISPNFSWQQFPLATESKLIRVGFQTSGDFKFIESHIWLRRIWPGLFPRTVEQSVRIYPKPEMVLLPMPIPPDLALAGIVETEFECLLSARIPKFGVLSEPAYTVSLEGWEI